MAKPESKEKTFVVGILHQHGGELATTLGKLDAIDAGEALQRAEFWLAQKRLKHKCKSYGDNCSVDVREAYTGLKSTVLACSAEEIN